MKRKLLQFGAGSIGRSFIGQLFARSGYEVVFADVDRKLVEALDRAGEYRVVVKRNEAADEILWVRGVRAIDAREADRVAGEIADSDLLATSVGMKALASIAPLLARGLAERFARPGSSPIDIIIAENIRSGAAYLKGEIGRHLPPNPDEIWERVGLVETSIGKMVPIMTQADRETDPLWVFAEAYNTLIVDRKGFRAPVPSVRDLEPVDRIDAYVDRKLFIHNLGHAAAAYLGSRDLPEARYIWETLEDDTLREGVRAAMGQAAAALTAAYPEELPAKALEEHIDDLLARFANRALADTIYRVGRDIYRKLGRDDRLVGAALLSARHGLPLDAIAEAIVAAASFAATDETGELFPEDARFRSTELPLGWESILTRVCGLDANVEPDATVRRAVLEASRREGRRDSRSASGS